MHDRILVADAGLDPLAPHLAVLGVPAEFVDGHEAALPWLWAHRGRPVVVFDVCRASVTTLAAALRRSKTPGIVVTDYPELVPMVQHLGVQVLAVLSRRMHSAELAAAIARELEGVSVAA